MSKKSFFVCSAILIFVALLVVNLASYFASNYMTRNKNNLVKNNAKKISATIGQDFQYLEGFVSIIGKSIIKNDKANDLKAVNQIFINFANTENSVNNIISWSKFDWVDKNNMQSVNTVLGVEKAEFLDMSAREYTRDVRKNPWQLRFASPSIGYPSRLFVIPVGVGVVDDKGVYQGLVVVGVDIKKLIDKISSQIDKEIGFTITDLQGRFFAFGSDSEIFPDQNFSDEFLSHSNQESVNNSFGFLRHNFEFKNYVYNYRESLSDKYPYSIIVGYKKEMLEKEIADFSFKIMLETFIIYAFAQALLIFAALKNRF